jgi:predicted ATP-dependent serine protease
MSKKEDSDYKCPVCTGFKLVWQSICDDCQKYKDHKTEQRKAELRRKAFGD